VVNDTSSQSANLDLLRSVAVSYVLVAHVFQSMNQESLLVPLGHIGVLLFFVHTTNVLLRSLGRLHADGTGRVWQRFFVLRIFRIYPLYLAGIIVGLSLRFPWTDWYGLHPSAHWLGWKWFAANLFLVQNLPTQDSISPPMWSLPYEMQMYLALPAIYLLTKKKNPMLRVFLVYFIAAATSRAIWHFHLSLGPPPIFYVLPSWAGYLPMYFPEAAIREIVKRRNVMRSLHGAFLVLLWAFSLSLCVIHYPSFEWVACGLLGAAIPYVKELSNSAVRVCCHEVAKIFLWDLPLALAGYVAVVSGRPCIPRAPLCVLQCYSCGCLLFELPIH